MKRTRSRIRKITAHYRCNRRACPRRYGRLTITHFKGEEPICKGCKKPLCPDKYRNSKREHRRTACECGGYHHIHRRGSLFCTHGAAGKEGWNSKTANCEEFYFWYKDYQNKKLQELAK